MYNSIQPFPTKEAIEKIVAFQKGDQKAGSEYLMSIMPYIYRETNKMCFGHRQEEFVSSVTYNVLLGMRKMDVLKLRGNPLTYLAWWVRKGITEHRRAELLIPLTYYHQKNLFNSGVNPFDTKYVPLREDMISVDKEEEEESQEIIALRKALPFVRLNEKERYVINECFIKDSTLSVAGAGLGLTRERARQLREAALKKIKKHLTKTPL